MQKIISVNKYRPSVVNKELEAGWKVISITPVLEAVYKSQNTVVETTEFWVLLEIEKAPESTFSTK